MRTDHLEAWQREPWIVSNGLKTSQSPGVASFRTPYPDRAQWRRHPALAAHAECNAPPKWEIASHPFDALNACLYRACRDAQGRPLTPKVTAASHAPAPRRSPPLVVP